MRRVEVVPHDPRWGEAFHAEAARISAALGPALLSIHHIGSTSIPGIHAKPVVDMLAEVKELGELDRRSPAMQSLGYEVMGEYGIPGRRYFRRDDATGRRTHQLHAFASGSPQLERHLAFRDFMIAHPEVAERYSVLKQQLAAAHPDSFEAYMDGKDSFIREVDARAARWRAAGGDR